MICTCDSVGVADIIARDSREQTEVLKDKRIPIYHPDLFASTPICSFMASKVKELASKIVHPGSSHSSQEKETPAVTHDSNMGSDLPKDYKVAVFESKGAPLTFKQVPLEMPKDGEVTTCPVPHSRANTEIFYRCWSKSLHAGFAIRMQRSKKARLAIASQLFQVMKSSVSGLCPFAARRAELTHFIGDVAAVPESEKVWKQGDRVGGPWHGGHDCKLIFS